MCVLRKCAFHFHSSAEPDDVCLQFHIQFILLHSSCLSYPRALLKILFSCVHNVQRAVCICYIWVIKIALVTICNRVERKLHPPHSLNYRDHRIKIIIVYIRPLALFRDRNWTVGDVLAEWKGRCSCVKQLAFILVSVWCYYCKAFGCSRPLIVETHFSVRPPVLRWTRFFF